MKTTIFNSLLAIFVAGSLSAQTPSPTQPKENRTVTTKIVPKNNDEKALNPQPLPPKDGDKKSAIIRKNTEEAPLNPQPLPPKDGPHSNTILVLSNGMTARIIGKNLMIAAAKGETKAPAGRYKTKNGRVLVINSHGEISN